MIHLTLFNECTYFMCCVNLKDNLTFPSAIINKGKEGIFIRCITPVVIVYHKSALVTVMAFKSSIKPSFHETLIRHITVHCGYIRMSPSIPVLTLIVSNRDHYLS